MRVVFVVFVFVISWLFVVVWWYGWVVVMCLGVFYGVWFIDVVGCGC